MKWTWLFLMGVTFVTGCDTLAGAQLQLVQQARRGIELQKQSSSERGEFVRRYYQLQRDRLDTAFDADARETQLLSPDWVIEHRRAYVAAVDAINSQRSNAAAAEAKSAENLAAIDAALDRLQSLLSIFQRGKNVFDQSQR